jgi:hypothetical protein
VAVAAAALGQRSSARVLEAGSSTCSCSTHGSGACAEGHALRAHVGFSRDRPLGVRRRLLRPAADDG